jgi:hypothetical protein
MPYETRYCAFVDILGFKGIVRDLERGRITYEALRDMLRTVHRPPLGDTSALGQTDFKAQSISDAVCLSTKPTLEGMTHLFLSLEALTHALLDKGYLIRGAVVKGHLYHDNLSVFGDALVRAYVMESTVARFPRIMLSRDVVDDYRSVPSRAVLAMPCGNSHIQAVHEAVGCRAGLVRPFNAGNSCHAEGNRSVCRDCIGHGVVRREGLCHPSDAWQFRRSGGC